MKPTSIACLLLFASTQALAGLRLELLEISSYASLRTPNDGSVTQDLFDDQPFALPFQLSAEATQDTQSALAYQDKLGFFRDRAFGNLGFGSTGSFDARAETGFFVVVSTDTPDQPLQVELQFFGAKAMGGSYYGAGDVRSSYTAEVSVGRNVTHPALMTHAWGFSDEVSLSSQSSIGVFGHNTSETDTLGAGVPASSFRQGWDGFLSFGEVTRDSFAARLDFGVIQPGETFAIAYYAEAAIFGNGVRYGGRAASELIDPLSLQNPLPGITIDGLELWAGPTAPVPEPQTWGLMLAGLALLAVLRRQRAHAG